MFNLSTFIRSRLIVIGSLLLLIILILIMADKMLKGARTQAAANKIAMVVHTNFPNFCADGQILATDEGSSYWGIKCDTWLKEPDAFYGDATILDATHCTTIRPLIGTTGGYYYDFETLNKSNGKRLAVCP